MEISFELQQDVYLGPLTTLDIGGPARFFVVAQNEKQIAEAFAFAEKESLDLFILGGGSNVLISDGGFDGLVLQIALKGVSTSVEQDGLVSVTANAGEDWDGFVS